MDSTMYVNKANQINPSPFLNKPINNTPKNCVLIYLSGSPDVTNLLHDRIKMIAKDGFIMGKKGSNISIIETDLQPAEIRDKLTSGNGTKAEIFVMSFNYIGYAGWLNSNNMVNVKSFFENR
jgi:hypothetical protein